MSSLHVLRVSAPHQQVSLCLSNLKDNDMLLLVDDGCYNLRLPIMSKFLDTITIEQCFIIKEHLIARGVNTSVSKSNQITYQQALSLIFNAQNVMTWQ
ncbi:sulfurtransferase complex subunit TusB [Thalassotalea ganghwensis]